MQHLLFLPLETKNKRKQNDFQKKRHPYSVLATIMSVIKRYKEADEMLKYQQA